MGLNPSTLGRSIATWRMKYAHQPWFRRYEYLFLASAVTVAFALVSLPGYGRPQNVGELVPIIVVFLLLFGIVASVVTDREKPVLLKRFASLTLIAVFFAFFYAYSGTQWDRVQHQFFNIERLEGVPPMLWRGLMVTVRISVVSAALAMMLGLLLGILRSLRNPVLELFLSIYIDVFRALPLIVNMVIVFYALPFLGIRLGAFWAAVTALVTMNSAYQAEIFRAGIESVPRRQVEAARALGLRPVQALRFVVIPQAVRIILPPLTNNLVSLVKDSAVAYVITVPELLTRARHAVVWKRNPTPIIFAMLMYLAALIPLTRLTRYLEKRSKRWVKQ